jgi:hypothetical protein
VTWYKDGYWVMDSMAGDDEKRLDDECVREAVGRAAALAANSPAHPTGPNEFFRSHFTLNLGDDQRVYKLAGGTFTHGPTDVGVDTLLASLPYLERVGSSRWRLKEDVP